VAQAKTKAPVKAAVKKAPLPEWKSDEAERMMKRRTINFLAKHGNSEVVADLQTLLLLSTKLTGYRRPCQLITAYKPEPEEEPEEEEAEEEEAEEEAEEEEAEEEEEETEETEED
jgi:cobalamin biosynthesis protein CobT